MASAGQEDASGGPTAKNIWRRLGGLALVALALAGLFSCGGGATSTMEVSTSAPTATPPVATDAPTATTPATVPPSTQVPTAAPTESTELAGLPNWGVTALVEGVEMVFDQIMACDFGEDDYALVQATGQSGAEFEFVLDGTESRVLIADALAMNIDAYMTYIESQPDGSLYVEASPPEMTITIDCP